MAPGAYLGGGTDIVRKLFKRRRESISFADSSAVARIDPRLIVFHDPLAFESEQYRMLGHLIGQAQQEAGLKVIAVSSAAPGDGKSTTAINLAGVLSQQEDTQVLLVEIDLRRPTVERYLRFDRAKTRGLVDAVLDPEFSLEQIECLPEPFNLTVIPAGRHLPSPHGVLRSAGLGKLFQEARQRYTHIIVDTPPLVPFTDCRLIEHWVDGFLVIVAAHKTPRKLLEEALGVLEPAKIIGLVFNRDDHLAPRYYAHNYYYYYHPQSSTRHKRSQKPPDRS